MISKLSVVRDMAVACLLLAGCAAPQSPSAPAARFAEGALQIPPQPVPGTNARPSPEPLTGRLLRPSGAGPFPVVIVLHGCGGISAGQTLWAERLNSWGYAALILDSFTPRGVRSVCANADQRLVTRVDRASDVLSAALFLRTLPGIQGDHIGVLGDSHGGGTAFEVTRTVFQDAYPGLIRGAVDYYAACRVPQLHGTTPLLALAGEDDTWGNPAKTCTEFATRLRPDQPFEVHTYPGVVHGFENPRNIRRTFNVGHPIQYDAAAAADSYARVHSFLDHYVGGRT